MTGAAAAIDITEPSPEQGLCLRRCQEGGSGMFSLHGYAGGGIRPLGRQIDGA